MKALGSHGWSEKLTDVLSEERRRLKKVSVNLAIATSLLLYSEG